jgi:hypothetical protein
MFRSYLTSNLLVAIVGALVVLPSSNASGQGGGNNNNNLNLFRGVVGGIKVDATGVVRDASLEDKSEQLKLLRESIKPQSGQLAEKTALRMVSLKNLEAAIRKSIEEKTALPEEMLYLAGLQKIEYVFAYPDQQDIVIAGPAEPWVVRDDSSVVGKTSGLPVLRLEDLLIALRSNEAAQHEAMAPDSIQKSPSQP